MKALDRLIIKAKNKCGYERLGIGFVSPSEKEPGKWIARGIFGMENPEAAQEQLFVVNMIP